jgi:hypothetical protein
MSTARARGSGCRGARGSTRVRVAGPARPAGRSVFARRRARPRRVANLRRSAGTGLRGERPASTGAPGVPGGVGRHGHGHTIEDSRRSPPITASEGVGPAGVHRPWQRSGAESVASPPPCGSTGPRGERLASTGAPGVPGGVGVEPQRPSRPARGVPDAGVAARWRRRVVASAAPITPSGAVAALGPGASVAAALALVPGASVVATLALGA